MPDIEASSVSITPLDEDGHPTGEPITINNIANVTMTVTEPRYREGERYMLAPNSTMTTGGRVFFENTEPIEVTVTGQRSEALPYVGNVNVLGHNRDGSERTQWVDPRFLTPISEPVVSRTRDGIALGDVYRVTDESGGHEFEVGTEVKVARESMGNADHPFEDNGEYVLVYATITDVLDSPVWRAGVTAWVVVESRSGSSQRVNVEFVRAAAEPEPEPEPLVHHSVHPEWPVVECQRGFAHTSDVHYHVTTGSAFNGSDPTMILFNSRVHEDGGYHTEPGVRYAKGAALATALAEQASSPLFTEELVSQVRDTEPSPEVPVDLPPPEEVLRRLTERDDIDPEVRRRRSIERITSLQQQITEARAAVDAARQERAIWMDRLIERAHVVADENDWCGVYDAAMEELGLPTRHDREPETETVTVTATVEISVNFDDEDFDSWFEDQHGFCISSRSNSTDFTFTIDVEQEAEVSEGECACDDDHDWAAVLPAWVLDNGYDWDIETTGCTND